MTAPFLCPFLIKSHCHLSFSIESHWHQSNICIQRWNKEANQDERMPQSAPFEKFCQFITIKTVLLYQYKSIVVQNQKCWCLMFRLSLYGKHSPTSCIYYWNQKENLAVCMTSEKKKRTNTTPAHNFVISALSNKII